MCCCIRYKEGLLFPLFPFSLSSSFPIIINIALPMSLTFLNFCCFIAVVRINIGVAWYTSVGCSVFSITSSIKNTTMNTCTCAYSMATLLS